MDYNKSIRYFVKLQSQSKFQKDLVERGLLYMNCAIFYRYNYRGEKNADPNEAEIFQGFGAIVDGYKPMYCLYSVMEQDITKGNKICLSKSFVKDFVNKETNKVYVTIIDADKFERDFVSYCEKNNKVYAYALVAYGRYNNEMKRLIARERLNVSLFTKRTRFKEQKEFRFVIYENVSLDENNLPKAFEIELGNITNYTKTLEVDFYDDDIILQL